MHFSSQVYRPPQERLNPLLEVTSGCSYNKCAFCSMYDRTPFCASPMEEIRADLQEIRASRPAVKRLYLVNGDPFALSAARLEEIALEARRILPELETLSCHASVRNLTRFSASELRTLRSLGYSDLYIGIETGLGAALELLRKGCTPQEQRQCLARLHEAGMGYRALLMIGCAGRGLSRENAAATAELLNQFPPLSMHTTPLVIREGSELAALRDSGRFTELTEGEMIEEEKLLVSLISVPVMFFGNQVYNLLPVRGRLPAQKEQILNYLTAAAAKVPAETLASPVRRAEGI
ncbi:MAG: radical SAM protein [Pyramidobacter sp.]